MTKVTNNSYVFKFVGGEPKLKRLCHYCRKEKKGGMVCVYGNAPDSRNEDGIFVCPPCVIKGCRESEEGWARLVKSVQKHNERKKTMTTEIAKIAKIVTGRGCESVASMKRRAHGKTSEKERS